MTPCIAPDEILPGELTAYLAGAATAGTRQHLARCLHCAAEARALARLDHAVRLTRYRAACPSPEILLRYQSGNARAKERRIVSRHVAQCAACAREVQQLAVLDAPQRSLWDKFDDSLRTIVEALRLSPGAQPALATRGDLLRPVLFQAGDLHIVLRSEPLGSAAHIWLLRGRITREGQAEPELRDRPVRLTAKGSVVAQMAVDELGYFVFEPIAAGRYDLWLEHTTHDIVVRDVAVGPVGRSL